MKALSIRQPWAWAIIHVGKDIENRDWKPWNPGLKFRGEFLIHASATMTKDEYWHFVNYAERGPVGAVPEFGELERGGIVGRAKIVDIVTAHSSPWFFGPIGLVIADAEPLPFRALKGQLGFFNVPAEARLRL
jgi:hypothetical protein